MFETMKEVEHGIRIPQLEDRDNLSCIVMSDEVYVTGLVNTSDSLQPIRPIYCHTFWHERDNTLVYSRTAMQLAIMQCVNESDKYEVELLNGAIHVYVHRTANGEPCTDEYILRLPDERTLNMLQDMKEGTQLYNVYYIDYYKALENHFTFEPIESVERIFERGNHEQIDWFNDKNK